MVRFWDTSALFPLFVSEPTSDRAREWVHDDPEVVVWTLTRVELLGAFARRRRERADRDLAAARRAALERADQWVEITGIDAVRHHAERLVEAYPLRAGDALQLGAALIAAGERPAELAFVTFDDRQADAAAREGFRVLGPR